MGGLGGDSSGDIFIAFSTANPHAAVADSGARTVQLWPNDRINSLFEATVDATEEAITNAMVAAETMTGANSLRVFALPRERVVESLRAHGRIVRKP
jgi:L-aminopeptidase/D-esterase